MIQYNFSNEDDHLDISFEGDLDIEATEIIHEEIKPLIIKYKSANLNLNKVPFVDSSGMGLLIDLVRTVEDRTKVTISEVKDEVFEVFELLQLPEILGRDTFIIKENSSDSNFF
jgi:anti-anti-sigma factor